MGLKFTDVLALSRAGFKANEIKEMIAAQEKEPGSDPAPEKAAGEDTTHPSDPPVADEKVTGVKADEMAAKEPAQPPVDEEKTKLENEITDLKKQISDLQAKNRSADLSGERLDIEKELSDIVRDFM